MPQVERKKATVGRAARGDPDALRIYLDSLRRLPRLSEEEEMRAAKRIEAGRRRAERALARCRKIGAAHLTFSGPTALVARGRGHSPGSAAALRSAASRAEKILGRQGNAAVHGGERRLCRRIVRGVQEMEAGRNRLVGSALRLVVWFARRYAARSTLPLLDLIQEGNIGLMRAADAFRWQRGRRFADSAARNIRWSMLSALSNQGRAVRIPPEILRRARRLWLLRQKLAQEIGREPTESEVATRAGILESDLRRLRALPAVAVPLDAPAAEGEERSLSEFIADPSADSPLGAAVKSSARLQVRVALESLPAREKEVITARYGLMDGEGQTLAAVGSKMSLTRERVRQIEARGLKRLARRLRGLSAEACGAVG